MVLFTRPMATLIPPTDIESTENYGEKLGAAALASHRIVIEGLTLYGFLIY